MRRYYLIDHKILFLFGYIFYLCTPYIVGQTHSFKGFPGMEMFQGFFNLIPGDKLKEYTLITLSWLPAFYLGHFVYKLFAPFKRSLQLFPASYTSHGVSYVAVLLMGVLILFTYISRNSLLGNYQLYDSGARGKMSTLLVIFNFFFLYQLLTKQKLSYILVAGTIVTAILLLTMGGRMYVIQTFIIYLIYKTSFAIKRWTILQILLFAFVALFVGSWVGTYRMGTAFNLNRGLYSLMAEPVFTWFSTSTFLIGNNIPVINFPSNFLTSFLNLVPNTIISFKSYVVSTQGMGYVYQNPLGADSVWSTFVINFGSVGSFCFIFITGFMLNFLRHLSENSRFWAAYYILVCGMLPFQFFRDGFYIINKQLFFNFLLLPVLILMVLKFVQYGQSLMESNFYSKKTAVSN